MNFFLIGVDHKRASIDSRETYFRQRQEVEDFWNGQNMPVAILATCNRFEIYGITQAPYAALRQRDEFHERFPFWGSAYFVNGQINVFRHALRLICGLESQLKGEKQIIRQVAYWIKNEEFPEIFKKLWDKAYSEGEQIRDSCALCAKERNIADFIFDDVRKKIQKENLEIIIAGTGNIAKLFSEYRPVGVPLNFVSTKHHARAKELAHHCQGNALNFKDLHNHLQKADVLIAATRSPHFILKKSDALCIVSRRTQPLYIYDLALPRVIEPGVIECQRVFLNNLDDIAPLFEPHNTQIESKLARAECLVEEGVKTYAQGLKVGDTAKQFSFAAG